MGFSSILSSQLGRNSIFYLIFINFHTLILSVTIVPNHKIIALWSGQPHFVTCKKNDTTSGFLLDSTFKWYSPSGVPVEENNKAPVYALESEDSIKLFLINISKKYSGTYECRRTLSNGTVISSDKFELKVYNAIDMENNRDSFVGTEGHSFSMPCYAKFDTDSSETTFSWSFNSSHIKDKNSHYRVRNIVFHKFVKSILYINYLTKKDEGTYTCQANYANPYLSDTKTIDINLRVNFKPRFHQNIQKTLWVSDDHLIGSALIVNITCLVIADPIAEFNWYTWKGIDIAEANLGIKYNIDNTENQSVLSLEYNDLNALRSNDSGIGSDTNENTFECRASNRIGEAKHFFHIMVRKLSSANKTEIIIVDVPIGTHNITPKAQPPVTWSQSDNQNSGLESGTQQYLALYLLLLINIVYKF